VVISVLDAIFAQGIKLVGVDTQNLDDPSNFIRPAHTALLEKNIAIVENLRGLDSMPTNQTIRFFAITQKAVGAAAFPVRAFAEV
jgi:arylformamidase